MNSVKDFRTDCSFWQAYRPCDYQKENNLLKCIKCEKYKKINGIVLIIETGGFGAMLRVAALLISIKKKFKDAKVIWLTRKEGVELLKLIHLIDEVVENSFDSLLYLSNISYEAIFNFETSKEYCTLVSVANSKQKFGFKINELGNIVPANQGAISLLNLQTCDLSRKNDKTRYVKLLSIVSELQYIKNSPPSISISHNESEWVRKYLTQNGLSADNKILVVNSGSSERWRAKRWPINYFADTVKKTIETFPKVFVVITGGPEDKEPYEGLVEILEKQGIDRLIYTGRELNLSKFISIISIADLVLTACTFGLHIAYCFNRPTISIHGPQSIYEVEDYPNLKQLSSNIECSPCFVRSEEDCLNSNKLECLHSVKPDIVFHEISKIFTNIP